MFSQGSPFLHIFLLFQRASKKNNHRIKWKLSVIERLAKRYCQKLLCVKKTNEMNSKLEFLNQKISSEPRTCSCPRFLYKYRPFDNFSFDMLEKGCLFLCPASKLDDETECDVSFDLSDNWDFQNDGLKKECIRQILEIIRPYSNEEDFSVIENDICRITNANGTIRRRFLLEFAPKIQSFAPSIDVFPLINWLANIPEKLDEGPIKLQIESLLDFGINAKERMGICSLAESCDIAYMWDKYAADHSGYCIEYEILEYILEPSIFPVIYQDDRSTNLVTQLVASFLGQTITAMSNGQVQIDRSQYLRLFLTKNKKWEYQKEWRILGDAGTKPQAPKISKIILGNNASLENKNTMKETCSIHKIQLIIQ